MYVRLAFYILLLLLVSCKPVTPLTKVLRQNKSLKKVAKNKQEYRLQIVYTRIFEGKDSTPAKLVTYTFNTDSGRYFYPASTVKLIVSALALEKMHTVFEDKITAETPLKAFANGPCQTNEEFDSTAENNTASIGHYIKRMLLVSDNQAYNRVFDFLGQDYLQYRLTGLGFPDARIIQRFDPACNAELNRRHNNFNFYEPDDSTIKLQTAAITSTIYTNPVKNAGIGNAYYVGDSLVHQPRQFRFNNNMPLTTLHESLIKLIYPYIGPDSTAFHLQDYDYRFLKQYLGMYPFESKYPHYDTSYFPAYKKYLFYGQKKNALIDSNLRIYNIVGQAYGFTTDAAYFSDTKNNVSFFLSATLYTNHDGILNDNKYEYETIAMPFLKALGREIYNYELKRHK